MDRHFAFFKRIPGLDPLTRTFCTLVKMTGTMDDPLRSMYVYGTILYTWYISDFVVLLHFLLLKRFVFQHIQPLTCADLSVRERDIEQNGAETK